MSLFGITNQQVITCLYSSHLYAALIDDIMKLQRRGLELHEFYNKKMYAEESYEVSIDRLTINLVLFIHLV